MIKKLFDDVNIDALSDDNAIDLHQRCFSLATHPRAPGYHKHAVTAIQARSELQTLINETEHELRVERKRTMDEKKKADKDFRDLIEIARSMIPEDPVLDHTFLLNCLLGLTRDAASGILKKYHDANGIT